MEQTEKDLRMLLSLALEGQRLAADLERVNDLIRQVLDRLEE